MCRGQTNDRGRTAEIIACSILTDFVGHDCHVALASKFLQLTNEENLEQVHCFQTLLGQLKGKHQCHKLMCKCHFELSEQLFQLFS